MWAIFKVLTELLQNHLCAVWFLAEQHVGLQLPNQESTPHPLQWKVRVPSAELLGESLNPLHTQGKGTATRSL